MKFNENLKRLAPAIFAFILWGIIAYEKTGMQIVFVTLFFIIIIALIKKYLPSHSKSILIEKFKITKTHLENNQQERLYVNVIITFLYGIIFSIASGKLIFIELILIWFIYCAYVITKDFINYHRTISNSTLGKAIIGIFSALINNSSYANSFRKISEIIQANPTTLNKTLYFLSIIEVPILTIYALLSATFISSFILPIYISIYQFTFKNRNNKLLLWFIPDLYSSKERNEKIWPLVFRTIFYGAFFNAIYFASSLSASSYKTEINQIISTIAYEYDMYHGNECSIIKNNLNEKISPLGDSKFLRGTKNSDSTIKFDIIKCDI